MRSGLLFTEWGTPERPRFFLASMILALLIIITLISLLKSYRVSRSFLHELSFSDIRTFNLLMALLFKMPKTADS
jgi:hypothetical protein